MPIADNMFDIDFDSKRDPQILDLMRKIYPDLSEGELMEAKANLEDYLKLAWKIAVRVEQQARDFDIASNNSYDTGTKVDSNH